MKEMNRNVREALLDALVQLGIDATVHRETNNNLMIQCPFAVISGHSKDFDSKPSFGLRLSERGFQWNCFTCGRSGVSFVDFVDALVEEKVIRNSGDAYSVQNSIQIQYPDFYGDKNSEEKKLPTPDELEGFDKFTRKFLDYNQGRGLSLATIKRANLMYDVKNRRVIFTCYDFDGKYLGNVGRSIEGDKRFYNSIDTGDILYLEWLVKEDTIGIVVEGMYDALLVLQHIYSLGLQYAYSVVGMFGAKVSVNQCKRLINKFDHLILMGDNDEAGIKMEKTIYNMVKKRITVVERLEYNGHDPGSILDVTKFKKYFQNNRRLFNNLGTALPEYYS